MTKNRLLILNIIFIILLGSIAIIERYPSRIYNKLKSQEISEPSYFNNWKYQQELGFYEYYQKKGQIVMLGNSITYRADWNELLNRGDIINRGIGSDITEGFLARMDYVYSVNPKLCFIMGGINDIQKGINAETIENNLYEITRKLKEKDIKPILFSILYVAENYPNYKDFNRSVKLANGKIKEMCSDNAIEYLDLNIILSENEILKNEYSLDGIHLTGLGYKKWREVISPIIEREIE
jgi:lysophospholipase L1-like esterase